MEQIEIYRRNRRKEEYKEIIKTVLKQCFKEEELGNI